MPFIMTRTHGNAIMPETLVSWCLLQVDGLPYTDVVGLAQGWGKTFRLGQEKDNWFHIPIPTVSYLDNSPMYLDQFFVFFNCDIGNSNEPNGIIDIDYYDGEARLLPKVQVPEVMAGDWSYPHEMTDIYGIQYGNTWVPRKLDGQRFGINTGLSISLHAHFKLEGNITFFSAGASWVDSPI